MNFEEIFENNQIIIKDGEKENKKGEKIYKPIMDELTKLCYKRTLKYRKLVLERKKSKNIKGKMGEKLYVRSKHQIHSHDTTWQIIDNTYERFWKEAVIESCNKPGFDGVYDW